MATLKPNHKLWIVTELAVYGSPSDVATAFRERFGVTITRQQVEAYDASKARNKRVMAADLVDLFETTRAEYEEDVKTVAIASKRWRLGELQEMYDQAKGKGLRKQAAALLEQGAKEAGDVFTNKRDLTTNGQPFKALHCVDLDAI